MIDKEMGNKQKHEDEEESSRIKIAAFARERGERGSMRIIKIYRMACKYEVRMSGSISTVDGCNRISRIEIVQ